MLNTYENNAIKLIKDAYEMFFICKKCGGYNNNYNLVTFKNNTQHLELICTECNRHLGYAPKRFIAYASCIKETKPKGKRIAVGKSKMHKRNKGKVSKTKNA